MTVWPVSMMMIREMEKGPHVVIVGDNPAKGFVVYGPFESGRAAMDWLNWSGAPGNVVPMERPDSKDFA